jgi:hypothetical protein
MENYTLIQVRNNRFGGLDIEGGNEFLYIQSADECQVFLKDCYLDPRDEGCSLEEILEHLDSGWTIHLRMGMEMFWEYCECYGVDR